MSQIVQPKKGYKSVPWLFGKEIEIPEEWEVKKINECCNILDSKRIPLNSDERKKIQGNIPYYGANGIQGYVNEYIFNEELILLAEDGGYFDEYNTRPIAQYVIGKAWVNNHAHVLSAKNNNFLKWIFYSLVHKNITPYINESTRTKLNQSDLKQILILSPPLDEQQKIADILSNIDNMITSTQKVIDDTRSLKQGLMQKLLINGIKHKKFKKIKWLFGKEIEIPEEWEVKKLKNITSKIGDGIHLTPKYVDSSEYHFINGNNLTNGKITFSENTKNVSKEEYLKYKLELNEKTILLSINGTIGNIAFYNNETIVLGKSASYIICNDDFNYIFLFYFLQSISTKKYFSTELTSTTIFNLSLASIRNMPIFYPLIQEQQKISSILSNVDEQITVQTKYREKLKKLKKSLMQKLLIGEIRVKV